MYLFTKWSCKCRSTQNKCARFIGDSIGWIGFISGDRDSRSGSRGLYRWKECD